MEKNKIRQFRKILRQLERLIDSQQKFCCNGATLAQCHVLLEVETLGLATTGQLADFLNLDKSTLSRTIDGLVNLGLLERLSNPQDRRTIPLSLTKQGKAICESINSASDTYYTKVLEKIPAVLRQQVMESFARLVQAFLDYEKDPARKNTCAPGMDVNEEESRNG
jgi:DNA-binding MarR family transcriptional regulator